MRIALYGGSDATTAIWPRLRAIRRGSRGSTVLSTPPTLTSKVLRVTEKASSEGLPLSLALSGSDPAVEKPLGTIGSGTRARERAIAR